MGEYDYSYNLPVDFENRAEHILHQMVAHNFFRELTTAWRNTDRAPAYDFRRLNNKSFAKARGQCLRTSCQSTRCRCART